MKTLLNLNELLSSVNGKLIGNNKECCFSSVQTDSRLVEKNTLFVPLIGEFQNGHKYIHSALEKGASVVFVTEAEYENSKAEYDSLVEKNPSAAFILVKNNLHALQDAAEKYVENKCQNMIKVAITGSCGKTTTKEMMVSVAKAYFGEENVAYTKGNFNSETGLPLSVFKINGNEKIGIFEMGMNRVNEIKEISKVYKTKYAIITNIGTAHIGILGSRENIATEKRNIFNYIPCDGAAFVPAEDDFADFCLENVKGEKVKFGKNIPENISGVKFVKNDGIFGTVFTLDGKEVRLPVMGDYNFVNALGVIACARKIGISSEAIKNGLENMKSVSGRMEVCKAVLKNGKKVVLVKDFYNANPDSMSKSIEFVAGLKEFRSKIFILADMKELGEKSFAAHSSIGNQLCKIAEAQNINAILIGEEIKPAFDLLNNKINSNNTDKNLYWVKDASEESFKNVIAKVEEIAEDNSVIMFKGSHSMNLETLCKNMQGAE